ncbi:unnamed protein product [Ectocarpus sp. 4 AP-2014]
MHRDIKSMNVGFAQNGSFKLLDFGLSKMVPLDSAEDGTCEVWLRVDGVSHSRVCPAVNTFWLYSSPVCVISFALSNTPCEAMKLKQNACSFLARVVTGGERPRLHRSWPDRLCKLLASAWHADHSRRPAASEVVAELRAIKAELPAKQRRQHPFVVATVAAVAAPIVAPSGAGDGSSSSGVNDCRERQSRPHSLSLECSSPSIVTPRTTVTATGSATTGTRLRDGHLRRRRHSFSSSSGSVVNEEGSEREDASDKRAGAAADDGDGHRPRRPQQGSFISRQKRLILDALARETKEIHIGRAKEADEAGIVVAALPPLHGQTNTQFVRQQNREGRGLGHIQRPTGMGDGVSQTQETEDEAGAPGLASTPAPAPVRNHDPTADAANRQNSLGEEKEREEEEEEVDIAGWIVQQRGEDENGPMVLRAPGRTRWLLKIVEDENCEGEQEIEESEEGWPC